MKSSTLLRPRNRVFIALLAVALALAEAFLDAVTWVELDVAAIRPIWSSSASA
jgi:hypothetical protein